MEFSSRRSTPMRLELGRFSIMKLLVTGGAGYVGGTTTRVLLEQGHEVTVLDDLSVGNRGAVPEGATFIEGDVRADIDSVLKDAHFDAVIHFAGRSLVGESVDLPDEYWQQNCINSIALLDAMHKYEVPRLVFSSSAATYGEPEIVPITEDAPTRPTNPYGATKLAIDLAISSYAHAYGIAAASLRYFNVAGAYHGSGENHPVETHLIPLVLAVALGYREDIKVFGNDWPTPDGTPIRDYIHIRDLAEAHILALQHAVPGVHNIYNLGSGTGFSVQQVIETCRKVTGHPIPAVIAPRRAGDPAVLVASSQKAIDELGWDPQFNDLEKIISDAWDFAQDLGNHSHVAQTD